MPIFDRAQKAEMDPSSLPDQSPATPADEGVTSPPSQPVDLSLVGEHIAAVLGAAETSANKIREQAEQERDRLLERVSQMAGETLAAVERTKEAAEADAQRLIDEATAAAEAVRAKAEQNAQKRRREAENQAAVVIRDGEERAAATGDLARRRHAVLLADLAATETRMRDFAGSLHGVALRLEEVLGGGVANESLGEDSLDATLAGRVTDGQSSLVES
jgi:hypothetical protein